MSINKVMLAGNLTRDPELKETAGGTSVIAFGIAVNERRKNRDGEWDDVPHYFDCNMFGTRASAVAKYLSKGMKVFVEGRLHFSQWEKDGQKRSKVYVVVDNIEFASSGQRPAERATEPTADVEQYSSIYDNDIPFN